MDERGIRSGLIVLPRCTTGETLDGPMVATGEGSTALESGRDLEAVMSLGAQD
jgi:hypothetical protein